MATQHVRFGGSSIHRVIECPASVTRQESVTYRAISVSGAATRGSALHNLAEKCFVDDNDPEYMEGKIDEATGYQFNERDIDQVRIAVAAVAAVCDDYGLFDYVTEAFVSFEKDVGGSADIIAWNDTTVAVLDYKFGTDPVDVESNQQALFYAAAAAADKRTAHYIKGREVVLGIIQPAVKRTPQLYTVKDGELATFVKHMKASIKAARSNTPSARPGDHCKYCAFAPHCPERRAQSLMFLRLDPSLEEDLLEGLGMLDQMKAQIKSLEGAAYTALSLGYPVRGWKLVARQAQRAWSNAATALAVLKGAVSDPKVYLEEPALRSPAQMEKALKKAGVEFDLAPLITRESSGNTIAPDADPRPAIVVRPELPEAMQKLMGGA